MNNVEPSLSLFLSVFNFTVTVKQKDMTNVACFHGQHVSCSDGIKYTTHSACLCNYFERNNTLSG